MKANYITTIGGIAEIYDGPHATPKKLEQGPYFLSISSLDKGRLELNKSAFLSEDDFKKWTKRVTPQEGDLLFSYETRLGEAALMPAGVRACLGRRMGLLRLNKAKVTPEYALYAYLSPAFQQTIKANTLTGATVDRIALNDLPNFPIRIPPIEEQKSCKAFKRYRQKNRTKQPHQCRAGSHGQNPVRLLVCTIWLPRRLATTQRQTLQILWRQNGLQPHPKTGDTGGLGS